MRRVHGTTRPRRDLVDQHDLVEEPRVDPRRVEDLRDRRALAQRLLHHDDAAVGGDAREREELGLAPGVPSQWKLEPRFSSERSAFCSAVE